MLVYHTSTIEITKPDVLHSRPRLDFGKGFYLTFLRSQSEQYGERYKIQGEPAIMNIYELDEERPGFSHKFFETYDAEWHISNGIADMHCFSDEYLTDELLLEYGFPIKQ